MSNETRWALIITLVFILMLTFVSENIHERVKVLEAKKPTTCELPEIKEYPETVVKPNPKEIRA